MYPPCNPRVNCKTERTNVMAKGKTAKPKAVVVMAMAKMPPKPVMKNMSATKGKAGGKKGKC